MGLLAWIAGTLLVLAVLGDAFETIVVPKTIERRMRISTAYARAIWKVWHSLVKRLPEGKSRQTALQSFGPLSLLFLFVVWAGALVFGFALVHWGLMALGPDASFGDTLYFSGVTFFTLGYGDITASSPLGRTLSVIEAGTGFGFLAIIISYVPVLYQSFSRREQFIIQLDSRAGSDPSGGELIRRHAEARAMPLLAGTLRDAEIWAAQNLETYMSYPILAYYRSQHDTQSWLTALTAVLDACSLILAGFEGDEPWIDELKFQAHATFAMARHVVVDVAYVLDDPPAHHPKSRITLDVELRLIEIVQMACGTVPEDFVARLSAQRALYEPYLVGLARDLHFTLPSWIAPAEWFDNWQRTAWDAEHF